MSLFIGALAFPRDPLLVEEAKLGVLAGSLVSAVLGYLVLRFAPPLAAEGLGLRHRRVVAEILVPRLDRAAELDRQRAAVAVHGLAGLDAHPAFGDAVLLDVGALARP